MELRVDMPGLQDLLGEMRGMMALLERKTLEEGLVAGAGIVRNEARQLAPELSSIDPRWQRGALKRAIAATRIRPEGQYAAEVLVRVRKLTKQQIRKSKVGHRFAGGRLRRADPRDAFYWAFVEFGTAKMRARPFLRPAFDTKKEAAVTKAIQVIRDRVRLEMQRRARSIELVISGLN